MTDTQLLLEQIKGLKQKEIAELLGVSVVVVCNWRKGRRNASARNKHQLQLLVEGGDIVDDSQKAVFQKPCLRRKLRRLGGVNTVAEAIGVTPQTIYKLFWGDKYPKSPIYLSMIDALYKQKGFL
jgi:predicted nucleic acid-binding protein